MNQGEKHRDNQTNEGKRRQREQAAQISRRAFVPGVPPPAAARAIIERLKQREAGNSQV
jgi:hypothetical protein